jgi:hypothetical protein
MKITEKIRKVLKERYVKVLAVAVGVVMSSSVQTQAQNIPNAQVLDMASRAATFIDTYDTIPMIIYTDSNQTNWVTAAEFYYMMTRWIRWFDVNGETATPPSYVTVVTDIVGPPSPSGSVSGTIYKADMFNLGTVQANFIDTNDQVPNYHTLGSTTYRPEAVFYAMSRVLRWYSENGSFPNFATVLPANPPASWTGGSTPPPENPPPAYPWAKSFTVPFTEQPDAYTCGPTSLRMSMGYYGTWYSVGAISTWMGNTYGDSPYYDGVGRPAILAAAQHYGFSGAVDTTGWANLKTAVQNNKPCITHIQVSPGSYPRYYPSGDPVYVSYNGGHYIVTCGLGADSSGNVTYAVVNDPARGQGLKYSASSFETAWSSKSYHFIKLN